MLGRMPYDNGQVRGLKVLGTKRTRGLQTDSMDFAKAKSSTSGRKSGTAQI